MSGENVYKHALRKRELMVKIKGKNVTWNQTKTSV